MQLKETVVLAIEATPGLRPNTFEIIGRLAVIASKPTLREATGFNSAAIACVPMIHPENSPEGAHYWNGVQSIIELCKNCANLYICSGENRITIKRKNQIKCVILK